ncbi:centromere protein O-like isoform X3 [Trematomus bernacchii]|uniref:centromere protein O-like isoform X3 n=1 Tax=Trematomus bernacchii TaxID=40690 RepID=UPI00146CC416|nr:centromere protein O-like isoform X3 [Trematomus bernacchii]
MEGASTKGILSHLSLLEVQVRSRTTQRQQPSRVKELQEKTAALRRQKEQLEAEIQTHKDLLTLRASLDKRHDDDEEDEEEMEEDSENSDVLRLMARHTQKDLLNAHTIGGYDFTKTRRGKGLCVSIATAFEGVYLETFSLEFDVKPALRLVRHDVPPFIPLTLLIEQSRIQTDIRTLLDPLSRQLNAFTARKRQLQLLKRLHETVKVMESNVLCSLIVLCSLMVLMFELPVEKKVVLCSLHYCDTSRSLPTRVSFQCDDKALPDFPEWKKTLLETPLHKALSTMRNMGNIL